jgi:hypothetical protein
MNLYDAWQDPSFTEAGESQSISLEQHMRKYQILQAQYSAADRVDNTAQDDFRVALPWS